MTLMTTTSWTSVRGVLVEGYRVASGPSSDYPYGTLDRQRPIFKERGLDLSAYFNGTLNVDIRPLIFRLIKPEFTFRNVEWTDLHPPEHFSFSHCRVSYGAPNMKAGFTTHTPRRRNAIFRTLRYWKSLLRRCRISNTAMSCRCR